MVGGQLPVASEELALLTTGNWQLETVFERRLKIFLALLVCVTAVLVLRAAQVQVVQKESWRAKAVRVMTKSRPIETTRGPILDVRGNAIAIDRPCIDACVDFRALTTPPDEKWVDALAVERLRARMRDGYRAVSREKRGQLVAQEAAQIRSAIDGMPARLAAIGVGAEKDVEDRREKIVETREEIVKKVIRRRKYVWTRNYQLASEKYEKRDPAPAWRRWLIDEAAEVPQREQFTNLKVAEEEAHHPVLKAISTEVQNEIRKHIELYPGLVLKPGVQRYYPYGEAACHLIGQLARVTREDLNADPNAGKDELREYYPNDLIGRTGLEKLAEPLLRGSRGRIDTVEGRLNEVGRVEAVAGRPVHTTIDIDLQGDVINMFRYAKVVNEQTKGYDDVEMHGAAVVIDVPTGEVRVLASYPTFDPNKYQEEYERYASDELNLPLLNRATQAALEPGSTVKPVVGLAAIAEKLIGVHDGIECTGFMVVNGRRVPSGRCWTESMFKLGLHHQIPYQDPHVGSFGNPDGSLMYSDAIQRSCNIYFETLGDRLKMEGLSKWFDRFGLGRPVGLGLPEVSGSLPTSYDGPEDQRRFATWIAAIGQGSTLATPIQMANVAATIARGGVWVRPHLIPDNEALPAKPGSHLGAARVDLGLPREAIAAAQEGMTRVVNTEAGSAFKVVRRKDLLIAGKTGTAQASRLKVKERDADGDVIIVDGKPKDRFLEPSSPVKLNPEAPWYRGFGSEGKDLKHSWFIGFAPADNPKVAFAVMVEYGGSGGLGAGLIAKQMIESLVERRYIQRNSDTAAPVPEAKPLELLQNAVGDE